MNRDAEVICTKGFLNFTAWFSEVHTFRRLVTLGVPRAVSALAEENTEWAQQVLSDPSYDSWFTDKAAFAKESGGVEGLADSMTAGQLSVFALSVDAAALVFMHSAVDAA